jgi:hypothetical protein
MPGEAPQATLAQRLCERFDQEDQQAVGGGRGEVLVKADVRLVKGIGAVAPRAHRRDRHLHVGQVAFRRALGREDRDVHLERAAHVEQVEQGARVAPHGAPEELAHERAVRRRHARTTALPDLQEAACLQRPRRLADGEAADAERLGELAFRRKGVARLEAVEDEVLEPLDDGVEDGAARRRLDLLQRQRFVSHAGRLRALV